VRGRHQGGFGYPGLTPMVQKLLIANAVVFLLQLIGSANGVQLVPYFAISVEGMLRGMLWQPFTYMWLHGNLGHIFFNMFALWMFGGQLEQAWGSRRFLRFYLICGVGAGFIILIWNSIAVDPYVPTLGASGAIYGLLAAFSLLWPNQTIFLMFPPMAIRAIWFIPMLFGLQILLGGGGNISHAGHLGGVIVAGWLLRKNVREVLGVRSLRYRWHRYRMRNRLRAVRREEWERRKRDDDRPPLH
jgi:membrane associated rhomboid family serine protease